MYLNKRPSLEISKPFFRASALVLFFSFLLGCKPLMGQSFSSMSFRELQHEIAQHPDKILVINFWATWCKPCVEELPDFEKLNTAYSDKNVEVWLINLDFNSAVEKSVKPFIEKRGLKSRVIHLTDTDPNEWVNLVDENWGGNIPATLIYQFGKRMYFQPNQLDYEKLVELISK